jgi:SAM-dependent methyltransferase
MDMHALPFPEGSVDIVIHSDSLEHVEYPEHAVVECWRMLREGDHVCYTVPSILGRLTTTAVRRTVRTGVHTEFGTDIWTYPVRAGFSNVRIHAMDFPSAIAPAARK